jgi:DNA repair protein RadD
MTQKFTLREYQQEAVDKCLWALDKFHDNSLCVIPTGGGKSLIISGVVEATNEPVLILQPSKEILEQNLAKLKTYVDESEIGVYSASLKKKDINRYTFATIQSIYKKPEEFIFFRTVIVDEAHLVDPKRNKSMYKSFFSNLNNPKVLGLTATPYRMVSSWYKNKQGMLVEATGLKLVNRMNPRMWNRIAYNINNEDLYNLNYLCPLKYVSRTVIPHTRIPLNKSGSDFDVERYEKMLQPHETHIIDSIIKAQDYRKSIAVFCLTVQQAKFYSKFIPNSACVSAETPMKDRAEILENFKTGKIKVILNVGILQIGFDHPALDTIYLLRPTRSLALYYQVLGRGLRLTPNKKECIIVDYSGSYEALGKVEDIKLVNEGRVWELYANNERMHGKIMYERIN